MLIYFSRRGRKRFVEESFFGLYAILMVLLVFLTKDMRARWIATIVPPLVVLSTYALHALHEWMRQRDMSAVSANVVTGAVVAGFLLPNLVYAMSLHSKIDPLPYITGRQSYEDYRLAHLPVGGEGSVRLVGRGLRV